MTETQVAAAWYVDPTGAHQLRYWDGTAWTEYVADDGVQSIAPLRTPAEQAADAQRAAKEAERAAARERKAAAKAEKDAAAAVARAEIEAKRAVQREERAERKAIENEHTANNPFAMFGSAILKGGMLSYEFKKIDMTDATAEASLGSPSRRTTLTRMGAGVLIAGPFGLVAGAVARKDTSKCYVTIGTPEGVIIIEGKSKDYPKAVKFADAVNRSKR